MQKFLFSLIVAILTTFPALLRAQAHSPNLKLFAHVDPLPADSSDTPNFSEVTGCGHLAILGGFNDPYVWIYDLSELRPELIATIAVHSAVLDVQVHGRYLFVALGTAMEWYDILDPAQPKLVTHFAPPPRFIPHTFFVAGNTLYVADYGVSPARINIFDITDKKNPKPLGTISDPAWSIHDMTIIRKRLYGAWIGGNSGLQYVDISDPTRSRELAKVRYPGAGTHSAWPTEDGQYILTADEIGNTRHNLKIWDARTPGQLTPVAEFTPPGIAPNSTATIHNIYVRGRYVYISYYCEGLRIVDISNPAQPVQTAFYDFNGNKDCDFYNSNWGVDPFSNLIYASDMQDGLYIVDFTDHPQANLTGRVSDAVSNDFIANAVVYFRDEFPTTRTNLAGQFEIPWFKNDTVWVVTEAFGYRPDTTRVVTSAANPTAITVRLKRAPSLSLVNTLIDDDRNGGSFGNNNGELDGAETYELNFSLRNDGIAAVTAGTVQLQSNDPYVKLVEPQQTLGPIPAGQTGRLPKPVRFSVAAITPIAHEFALRLHVVLNNEIIQDLDFTLPAQNPIIRNFRASSSGSTVTLTWRRAEELGLQGYHLYHRLNRETEAQFVRLTATPVRDTTFTAGNFALNEIHVFAITKVVNEIESLAGSRITRLVRAQSPRLLVVNGVSWSTYTSEMTDMYAAFPFNAGQPFDTWDVVSLGQGFPDGYTIISQSARLTVEELRGYEAVIWVGNNFGGDFEVWNESLPEIKKYLDDGGRLVLLTRRLNQFLQDTTFVKDYLHIENAQFSNTFQFAERLIPQVNDLTIMNSIRPNGASPGILSFPPNPLVAPIFRLESDPGVVMGLRARKTPAGPYNLVVIAGRPYRYDPAALKANMTVILTKYFGLNTAIDAPKENTPHRFALLPNYPNPFSPAATELNKLAATQIIFQLPGREHVQLEIFNLLGQRVRVLLNATRESGTHAVLWDGKNEAGQNVAAGVYIMRLRAGEFIAERKMTMVR